MTPALVLLNPTDACASVGCWFRVLLPGGCSLRGRISGVAIDGKTLLVEDCPLSRIDPEDVTIWLEKCG